VKLSETSFRTFEPSAFSIQIWVCWKFSPASSKTICPSTFGAEGLGAALIDEGADVAGVVADGDDWVEGLVAAPAQVLTTRGTTISKGRPTTIDLIWVSFEADFTEPDRQARRIRG
jgi:hypothetical protein